MYVYDMFIYYKHYIFRGLTQLWCGICEYLEEKRKKKTSCGLDAKCPSKIIS